MTLTKHKQNFPVKPQDLSRWILIGKAKLSAQIAAIKGISRIEEGFAAKEAALADTQDLAEELLYAEARLGEMLAATEKKGKTKEYGSNGGTIPTLPAGIDKKQSHYAQELSRHEDKIAEVVAEAREKGEVPVRQQVLKAIQAAQPKSPTPEIPKGSYDVIYADPPWQYDFSVSDSRQIENQYPTMDVEAIKALEIPSGENAVLYLWATSPKLPEALEVMRSWGFTYRSSLVWDKEIVGMGYWFRNQHELLLLGTKGQVVVPSQSERVSSVLRERRGEHSKKPVIVREWIKKWHPKANAIELFAREKTPGWTVWGNEAA